jgi:hypothetical protein
MSESLFPQTQKKFKKNKKNEVSIKREFEQSDEIRILSEEIIKKEFIDIYPAKVAYLLVTPNISKIVPIKIIKSSPELKHFSDYNYLIEVSADLWTALSDDLRYILLHDQLLRILTLMNEKTGDYTYKLRQPDYIAFKKIIDLYGTDWKSKVKLFMSSIHSFTPAQEDSIKL